MIDALLTSDQIGARKAAMMDIMAQLHKNGWLKEVFSAPAALDLDLNTIKTKVDAKTDVYNYCARFGLLPRFHVSKPSPEDLIKSKRSMLRRRKGSKEYQAQITLPEQDITVLGFGTSYLSAEIAASVSFKQKVEERARSQQSESFSVLHPYALTSFSAAQFYKFYRTLHKGVQFEYASTQASVFGTSLQQSQMTHNGLPLGEVALMPTKKQAEELAALIGAVTLAQREAGLLQQFQDALKHGKGQILARVLPRELVVNREMAMTMRKTARDAARQGLHSFRDEIIAELETTSVKLRRRASSPRYLEQRSQQLLSRATGEGSATRDMEEMRQKRNELPMSKHKAEVLNLVNENSYSIIVGATGSGKTTQVPQILLEDAIEAGQGATCNVICTQPRRIAATSVARRVASERGEQLGDTVGYHVRNDRKPPNSNGGITYCTTGILLQQLKSNADLTLEGVSHIVIDEVHERDLFVDFLLVVLKTALANRVAEGKPIPKVTLMSATMDTELFADYFKSTTPSGEIKPCPSLVVPGRLFPVTSTHVDSLLGDMRKSYSHAQLSPLLNELDTKSYIEREIQFTKGKAAVLTSDAEDDDAIPTINWRSSESTTEEGWRYNPDDGLVPVGLVAATIAHVVNTSEDGSILVFLPGKEEILRVQRLIERSPVLGVDLNDRSRFKLHILHSSTPAEQQAAVFLPTSEGCRKIILATNIAETSVTIPDVQHVIDSGKLRERRYDFARQIDALLCTWISKANSRQRAGRAGRVQNGNYYALFSQERFESLRVAGEPEMLRADLQEVGLMIKAHGFNMSIANFLEQSVQPPSRMAVQTAIENLKAVKALTENEDLTELGRVLSGLHVNPSLGKMIVMGIVFRCLDSVILLGALIGSRSMFLRPAGQRREYEPMHRLFVGKARSDHLSGLNAYRTLRKIHVEYGEAEARRFAVEHYLSMSAFNAITSTCQEIMKELMESGLIPKTDIPKKLQSRFGDDNLNENSENGALLKGLLIGGLSSNIAVHTGNRFFRTAGESDVMIHPSSLNAPPREERADYRGASFVYSALAQSSGDSRLMLRDTTEVSPLEIALFGGKLQESTKHSVLEMDGWLPFWVKGDRYGRSDLLLEFRSTFEKVGPWRSALYDYPR